MRENNMLDFVALLSALGCGLVAGIFFAFSTMTSVCREALSNQHSAFSPRNRSASAIIVTSQESS
jgi:uncharacterized membrane protein